MSKYVFEWQRLNSQEVTVKPKVFINGDSFRVEYYGPLTQGHCGTGFPTLDQALEHANKVARRNPVLIKAINKDRDAARQRRIERRHAVRYVFGVAA